VKREVDIDLSTGSLLFSAAKVFAFFELDIKEAVWGLVALVNISHLRVRRQNFLAVDKEGDRSFLPERHPFANDLVELDRLKVIWNQEPGQKLGYDISATTRDFVGGRSDE